MLIAEKMTSDNEQINVYQIVEMEDLDWDKFQTKQFVGSFSKQQLLVEKEQYQKSIDAIDEKLDLFK